MNRRFLPALLIAFLISSGCGARQQVNAAAVSTADLVLVQTDHLRLSFYEERDERCRRENPPISSVYMDWRRCMEPAYRLKTAVEVANHAFRALGHALEASEQEGIKEALKPTLDAVAQLVHALTSAGVGIPEEITDWIAKLRSLARLFL